MRRLATRVRGKYAAALAVTALLLMFGAAAGYKWARKPWQVDGTCAPPGEAETRLRREFLGDGTVQLRYRELFLYFTRGFMRHLSPGYSRVQFCGAGSNAGLALDGLEGFARTAPLLAAWVYSGREKILLDPEDGRRIDLVSVLSRGILSGVDPHSNTYWGEIGDNDQRIVEAADIARILWLTRASIWEQLREDEKLKVTQWLLPATQAVTPQDNWILFPVIIDLVLAKLHAPAPESELIARARRALENYRRFYLESGWFSDGSNGADFYNIWGITYDLLWIRQLEPTLDGDFVARAISQSAALTEHLISPLGIPIMGRSICYRTAVPVPVLAAEFSEPAGAASGHALRALDAVWRYFIGHGAVRDGALTQGYFAADLRFLDNYSGAGSCQWGLRSLTLAFMYGDGDHFWIDPPALLPVEVADYQLEYPKIGWRITAQARSGEIAIEILKNGGDIQRPVAYTSLDRFLEMLLRRPFRPGNHAAKYDSRVYSSADPFPLQP